MNSKQTMFAVILLTLLSVLAIWLVQPSVEPAIPGAGAPPGAAGAADDESTALLKALEDDPAVNPKVLAALQQLRADLDAQQRRQVELSQQLAQLDVTVFSMDAAEDAADANELPAAENPAGARSPGSTGRRQRMRLSQERLVESGFTEYEAEDILTAADNIAMERLNLQYKATREGWLRTPEYAEAMRELPVLRNVMIEEYGEVGYDRYLYASGRPNRLVVTDVYRESPAATIGLQSGDRVIAMAGEPVYSDRDLRTIASKGSAGETVPVVIERDGTRFETYVPRGPLGIRAGRAYENPAAGPGS